jgi:hypothetical protein
LGCSKRLKGKDISGGWNKKTPLVRGNSLSLAGTHQYWQYSAAFDNIIHFMIIFVKSKMCVNKIRRGFSRSMAATASSISLPMLTF